MALSKTRPSFEIRFFGRGIRPELISLRLLTRALDATQRLVCGDEVSDENESETCVLHLLAVKHGSAVYPVYIEQAEPAVRRLQLAGDAIIEPEKVEDAILSLSAIQDLSQIAKSLGCQIEFRYPGKSGDVLAKISPDSYARLSSLAFVVAETSITGRVERVGGATSQRAALRLPQQPDKLVYCHIEDGEDEKLCRLLGQHLYEDVTVTGTATWYRKSWRLKTFTIKSVEGPPQSGLALAFKKLRDAGGKAWDSIPNPEAFLQEVRGE